MYNVVLRFIRPTELKIPKVARTLSWIICIGLATSVVIGMLMLLIGFLEFSFPLFISLTMLMMLSIKLLIDCAVTDEDFIESSKTFVMYHIRKDRSTLFDVEDPECDEMRIILESNDLTIDSNDLIQFNDLSLQVKNATQIIITLNKKGTKISSKSIIWYHPAPSLIFENDTGVENDLLHFKLSKVEMIDVSSEYDWYGVELRKPEKLACLHYKALSSNSAIIMSKLRKRIGNL